MVRSPILRVLSVLRLHDVRHLLMGGQACVLYGGAEFSRDTDIAFLPDERNERSLLALLPGASDDELADALAAEEKAAREADQAYWAPLRKELEQMRRGKG